MNNMHPLRASQWTHGRYCIGDHELKSGDLIEFIINVRLRAGRVEHDKRGYIVIADDMTFLLTEVREARLIRRAQA